MQELGKTVKDVYNAILTAYRIKDKKQGAKDALAIYGENVEFIDETRKALSDIDELVAVLEESLSLISRGVNKKTQVKGKGSVVSKLVPCGKNCNGCPHGPYLYKVSRVDGKLVWRYLGRAGESEKV